MIVARLLQQVASLVSRHPVLLRSALFILDRIPPLKAHLARILVGIPTKSARQASIPKDLENLPPRARQLYQAMKSACDLRDR